LFDIGFLRVIVEYRADPSNAISCNSKGKPEGLAGMAVDESKNRMEIQTPNSTSTPSISDLPTS
jgi:hypothetical protein